MVSSLMIENRVQVYMNVCTGLRERKQVVKREGQVLEEEITEIREINKSAGGQGGRKIC